tara:strand:- start:1121 stop:1372 length:252 start_codon:yes stop_codon:yes gene_type:complete
MTEEEPQSEYLHVHVIQYPEMTREEAVDEAAKECGPRLFKHLIGKGKCLVQLVDFSCERMLAMKPVCLPHCDFMAIVTKAKTE